MAIRPFAVLLAFSPRYAHRSCRRLGQMIGELAGFKHSDLEPEQVARQTVAARALFQFCLSVIS
jgi:hypothetical protein